MPLQKIANDCNIAALDAIRASFPAAQERPAPAEVSPRLSDRTNLTPVVSAPASKAHDGEQLAVIHVNSDHIQASSPIQQVSVAASPQLDGHFRQGPAGNDGISASDHTLPSLSPQQQDDTRSDDPQPRLTTRLSGSLLAALKSLPLDQANDPVGRSMNHNMGPDELRLPHCSDLTELLHLQEPHASSQRCVIDKLVRPSLYHIPDL